LAEYDAADRDGKGALLRREAIYTSHISEWRKARDRGTLHAPARRRKSAEQVELERLRERTERHGAELAKTKLALDITPAISDEAAKLHPGADPRLAAAPAQRIDVAGLRTRHQPDRAGLDQLLRTVLQVRFGPPASPASPLSDALDHAEIQTAATAPPTGEATPGSDRTIRTRTVRPLAVRQAVTTG
jgi:transposase